MKTCPTGYCGNPCFCPSNYDHLNAKDCKDMISIFTNQLTKLADNVKGVKTLPARSFNISAAAYGTNVFKVYHLIEEVPAQDGDSDIWTRNGIISIYIDEDGIRFKDSHDPKATGYLRYELCKYRKNVSIHTDVECADFSDLRIFVNITDTTLEVKDVQL